MNHRESRRDPPRHAPALDAGMDIRYAIRQMNRFALTHCIVVEARQLAGIVTLRDLTMR